MHIKIYEIITSSSGKKLKFPTFQIYPLFSNYLSFGIHWLFVSNFNIVQYIYEINQHR